MELLVTGGAGYIGSHIVIEAMESGHNVTVFDDLSSGSIENIKDSTKFVQGSTLSTSDLESLFEKNNFDGVIHLAANKAAGESMERPSDYSTNNIIGGHNLINVCSNYGIKIFIFSSTAAVYGDPQYVPIDEDHQLRPSNYYGYTKLALERNLEWFSKLKGINYASLRYFNAAGYDTKGRITGLEKNPQNLIPIVMENAIGIKASINVYGDDYKTKDGTGVRDYIHVNDLAVAHIKALEFIFENKSNLTLNLGTGYGYSVLDVINRTSAIIGKNINYEVIDRRDGDTSIVIAKPDLAMQILNWEPKNSNLDIILKSTWNVYKIKESSLSI